MNPVNPNMMTINDLIVELIARAKKCGNLPIYLLNDQGRIEKRRISIHCEETPTTRMKNEFGERFFLLV